jgi:hypothetical protein
MPTVRTAAEILEYHCRSVAALLVLARGGIAGLGLQAATFPRTEEAFIEALDEMRDELDDEVVLALVASGERVLRLDYRARQAGGAPAAVRFRHLEERHEGRVPLEEILDVWKDVAAARVEIGHFKQMYVYRHGLAHGRFFNKSGLHHAKPADADAVIRELFAKIKVAAEDFPSAWRVGG